MSLFYFATCHESAAKIKVKIIILIVIALEKHLEPLGLLELSE
jgi:hypothetical protein